MYTFVKNTFQLLSVLVLSVFSFYFVCPAVTVIDISVFSTVYALIVSLVKSITQLILENNLN